MTPGERPSVLDSGSLNGVKTVSSVLGILSNRGVNQAKQCVISGGSWDGKNRHQRFWQHR